MVVIGQLFNPVTCLLWIIVGGIAGSLAGKIVQGESYGFVGDVLVGLGGAILGNILFGFLGISLPGGLFAICSNIFVSVVGAVIFVYLLHAVTNTQQRA